MPTKTIDFSTYTDGNVIGQGGSEPWVANLYPEPSPLISNGAWTSVRADRGAMINSVSFPATWSGVAWKATFTCDVSAVDSNTFNLHFSLGKQPEGNNPGIFLNLSGVLSGTADFQIQTGDKGTFTSSATASWPTDTDVDVVLTYDGYKYLRAYIGGVQLLAHLGAFAARKAIPFDTAGSSDQWLSVHVEAQDTDSVVRIKKIVVTTDNVFPPGDLASNLSAYYSFDGDLHDHSGNGHGDATTGVTATYATGQVGQALQLNGSTQYAELPLDLSTLLGSNPFTICGWYDIIAFASYLPLFSHQHSGANVLGIFVSTNGTDGTQQYIGINGTENTADCSPAIVTGWNDVVLSYDGTVGILYVKGVPVGELAASGGTQTGSEHSFIGGNVSGTSPLHGAVQEFRIYAGRAFNINDVLAFENFGSGPTIGTITVTPNPVTSTIASFSAALSGWTVAPTTTANGTGITVSNLTANTTAMTGNLTFTSAGTKTLSLSAISTDGTANGTANITVSQTLTSIVVTGPSKLANGDTGTYTATGYDQFGTVMSITPTWSNVGGGTIDGSTGVLSGDGTFGRITATAGGVSGSLTVNQKSQIAKNHLPEIKHLPQVRV